VLFDHEFSAAPHQTASPVCGTKNFVSVRLYSAPQLYRTIVAILGICTFGEPVQAPRFGSSSPSGPPDGTNEKFQMVLRLRHVVSTKFSRSLHCCCSCEHAGATVIRRDIWQDKQ
jgi:hypothetical protein